MKTFVQMLIGAAVGFFAMYAVLAWRNEASFVWPSTEITMGALIISLIGLLYSVVGMRQIQSRTKEAVRGDEEDEREDWIYKKFGDVSLAANVGSIVALFSLSVAIISDEHPAFMIVACVLVILSYIIQPYSYSVMKKAYPYRPFPALSEKKYAEKLLAMSDEGERHVMFGGLHKVYMSINGLLPIAIILLMFYSSISGQSQLFSILIITLILIYINVRYLTAIRPR